jgi:hypothetical protein
METSKASSGIFIGTLFGLGVLGAMVMAKKKAAKKVTKKATTKKPAAKKATGVMSSRDIESDDDEFEIGEDGSEVDRGVVDAHGNAGLDEPTPLDKPTQI